MSNKIILSIIITMYLQYSFLNAVKGGPMLHDLARNTSHGSYFLSDDDKKMKNKYILSTFNEKWVSCVAPSQTLDEY